jgi:hypothetical protein
MSDVLEVWTRVFHCDVCGFDFSRSESECGGGVGLKRVRSRENKDSTERAYDGHGGNGCDDGPFACRLPLEERRDFFDDGRHSIFQYFCSVCARRAWCEIPRAAVE